MTAQAQTLDISPRMQAILGALRQARELCATSEQLEDIGHAKCSDQQKRPPPRPVITKIRDRRRKYAIETGYDTRTGQFLKAPLEPWTCPNPQGAWLLYREIIDAPDGSLHLSQYRGRADLRHLEYMQHEKLIGFDARGWIHVLGDPDRPAERSKYPGAPVPDTKAATGKQLRGHAAELVMTALRRLFSGRSLLKLSKQQKRQLAEWRGRRGMPLGARWICWEANLIKRLERPDLADHRFLSVDTCRRVLRVLRDLGKLTVLRKVRRFRADRSWKCDPAVYEAPPPDRGPRVMRT